MTPSLPGLIELGFPVNDDFNGADQEGVGPLQVTVRGRRRCSAAVGYLRPAMRRPNLTVEIRALAHRVLTEGNRAVAVEFSQNGTLRTARARREVLLCGGSINSPQLLQLSGIGPADLLAENGIPVVHDLPGVGENLQDHIGARVIYRCHSANTVNEISHSLVRQAITGLEYLVAGRGALMMGAAPIGLFARTRPELDSPDVQYQFLAGSSAKAGEAMHDFPACSIVAIPCRPESRGWLRIRSPDPRGTARDPAQLPRDEGRQGHDHCGHAPLAQPFRGPGPATADDRGVPARPAGARATRTCWSM